MTTITEDYVSFETAKLLKEKGFDLNMSPKWYNPNAEDPNYVSPVGLEGGLPALTLQMACKWLREAHGLHIEIMHLGDKPINEGWFRNIQLIGKDDSIGLLLPTYSSFEEACDEAIKYCLEKLV